MVETAIIEKKPDVAAKPVRTAKSSHGKNIRVIGVPLDLGQ